MAKRKQGNKARRKWCFWAGIIGILALGILLLIICLNSPRKITICTEMDYQGGDIGPCVKYKEVEIVARPKNQSECPIGTEPVYNVIGGFVGIDFVGCAESQ